MKKVIAIDFDGTCVTHEFPNIGRSIGAEKVLKKLTDKGHNLVLFTMRCDDSKHGSVLTQAVNWFHENNIPLYGVQVNPTQKHWTSSPKVYAHLYIDDAALGCPLQQELEGEVTDRPFVDWVAVEQMLTDMAFI